MQIRCTLILWCILKQYSKMQSINKSYMHILTNGLWQAFFFPYAFQHYVKHTHVLNEQNTHFKTIHKPKEIAHIQVS